jgi:rubrerythrin
VLKLNNINSVKLKATINRDVAKFTCPECGFTEAQWVLGDDITQCPNCGDKRTVLFFKYGLTDITLEVENDEG